MLHNINQMNSEYLKSELSNNQLFQYKGLWLIMQTLTLLLLQSWTFLTTVSHYVH